MSRNAAMKASISGCVPIETRSHVPSEGNLRPTQIPRISKASITGFTSPPTSIITKFASDEMKRHPSF